jgi:hypothetical protein
MPESTVSFTQCSAGIESARKSLIEDDTKVCDLICPTNMSMKKLGPVSTAFFRCLENNFLNIGDFYPKT